MRSKFLKNEAVDGNYDLSISDLMSALCCIFLLFLTVTILQLNKQKAEYAAKNGVAERYNEMQKRLKEEIESEFREDFKVWKASISDDLTIHFNDINILFDSDKAELKDGFKNILDEFFPRLIKVLAKKDYVKEILEIRIEGHTAKSLKDKYLTPEEDYKTGMDLSQKRTTNVLFYCLQKTKLLEEQIDGENALQWVRKRIAAIGYSNSIEVMKNGQYDQNSSRRVEVKIKTKAENVISEIRGLSENK